MIWLSLVGMYIWILKLTIYFIIPKNFMFEWLCVCQLLRLVYIKDISDVTDMLERKIDWKRHRKLHSQKLPACLMHVHVWYHIYLVVCQTIIWEKGRGEVVLTWKKVFGIQFLLIHKLFVGDTHIIIYMYYLWLLFIGIVTTGSLNYGLYVGVCWSWFSCTVYFVSQFTASCTEYHTWLST